MDKKTFSQYGWIVIVTIIICILIGGATPFAQLFKTEIEGVFTNLNNFADNALGNVNGGSGGGDEEGGSGDEGEITKLNTPRVSAANQILTITTDDADTEEYDVYVDGALVATIAAEYPTTEYSLNSLGAGTFNINVVAKSSRKNNSNEATIEVVDGGESTGLVLTVQSPQSTDQANPSQAESLIFTVKGSASADKIIESIKVNGEAAMIFGDGSWSTDITLIAGKTTEIIIVLTDDAGETVTETRYVYYDNSVNEYGFYFNVPYVTTDEDYRSVMIFREDGFAEIFSTENNIMNSGSNETFVCDAGLAVKYDELSATDDEWGNVLQFSADGKTVDANGFQYTLSDEIKTHGVYFDRIYKCDTEGYESTYLIFGEDGSVTMVPVINDVPNSDVWLSGNHVTVGTDTSEYWHWFSVSLDGTYVYFFCDDSDSPFRFVLDIIASPK